MVDLEQFVTRIPDAWSIITIFSSTETFYLTKCEIRTQKSQTQPLNYCFVEMYYFYQIMLTLCKKNNDISAKLKWISQYIWQAVHTNFADYAIILVWKTWSSALNHLNC